MLSVHSPQAFERLLFRATRGNMYLRNAAVGSVVDPVTGEKQEKAVFVVFFAGERARTKILKARCPRAGAGGSMAHRQGVGVVGVRSCHIAGGAVHILRCTGSPRAS